MREAWTPRTQLGIVGTSRFWTFVTLRAPGHAHWAAAGIHTVLPWDGSPTAVVIMCEVAVLRTQVWKVQAFTPPRSKTKKKTFIINLDLKTPQDHPTTHTGCCSPTDAHPATEINSHSWRALAVEGAWCVDAFAVDTNARKHLTFVHIWETTDRQTTTTDTVNKDEGRDLLWTEEPRWNWPSQTFPFTLAKPLLQIGSGTENTDDGCLV